MALNGEFELSPGVVAGTLPARSARVRFVGGARLGIPVAIGYFLISLSFGALSPQTLSFPGAMLMSLLVFAGAAQFMAVGMLAAGASVLQIIIATLFVGLRGSVVSLALAPKLSQMRPWVRNLVCLGVTDGTFAVAAFVDDDRTRTVAGMSGLLLLSLAAWIAGTFAGVQLSPLLPLALSSGMQISIHALFITLLLPALRAQPQYVIVVAAAVASHVVLRLVLPPGWALLLSIIVGAVLGPFIQRDSTGALRIFSGIAGSRGKTDLPIPSEESGRE